MQPSQAQAPAPADLPAWPASGVGICYAALGHQHIDIDTQLRLGHD